MPIQIIMKYLVAFILMSIILSCASIDHEETLLIKDAGDERSGESMHYVLSKISNEVAKEIRVDIRKVHQEIGYGSLKVSMLSFGKSDKSTYLLIRRFGDYNEAQEYTDAITLTAIAQHLIEMNIFTQQEYRQYVTENS